jgi:hypothetical protein
MTKFLWLLLGGLLGLLLCLVLGWNWWPVAAFIVLAFIFLPFAFRRNGPRIHGDYDHRGYDDGEV